jgi:hypothetical protein
MRHYKHKKRNYFSPPLVSPLLPPEAQGVGRGILGVSALFNDFKEIVSGPSTLRWYDQILHVSGAVIILGLLIGVVVQRVLEPIGQ